MADTLDANQYSDLDLIHRARQDATRLAAEDAPALRRFVATPELVAADDTFPGYAAVTELHRGAQGVVYRAIQLGTGRIVAIKVVQAGPLSVERDARRFEREVAALTRLRHPNIVAIHDSGVISDHGVGRFHYFVMDFVDGPPLDQWSANQEWSNTDSAGRVTRGARRRAARARLEPLVRLFTKVCDAVNAAHLRGVLHRDLKPGNVRVDASGEPQVLDFGLAKFLTDDLGIGSSAAAMTVTGQFVGSLPWASPEQAEGRHDLLDLRSDVYSLGVLLFQLLTNRFPYEVGGGLRRALESITSAPPIRPSTLRPEIDEELETIVLKCLRKEPQRRYDTAGELARDLRRYLDHEPIEAKRDSGWYMFKKAVRRHRVPAFASALFLALLILGFGIAVIFWQRADRERAAAERAHVMAMAAREEALAARQQAEAASAAEVVARASAEDHLARAIAAEQSAVAERDRAIAAEQVAATLRQQAEAEAARSGAIATFMQNMLAQTDPHAAAGAQVTLEEVLDQAADRAETSDVADEAVSATLMETIAGTYQRLGLLNKAEDGYRAAIATRLGAAVASQIADPDQSQRLLQFAQAIRQRGDYAKAEELLQQLLAESKASLGTDHPRVAGTLTQLSGVLREQGRSAVAEPIQRQALEIYRKTLGEESADTAGAYSGLGWLVLDQGRYDEADEQFRKALEIRTAMFGPESEAVAWSRIDLGWLAQRRGELAIAEEQFRDAQAAFAAAKGAESKESIDALGNVAQVRRSAGDLSGAEALFREALAAQQVAESPDPIRISQSLDSLGWVLMEQSDFVQAQSMLREAYELRRTSLGDEHPSTLMSMRSLAAVHARQHDDANAAGWLEPAAASYEKRFGPEAWQTAEVRLDLGEAYARLGRDAEAEPLLLKAFATLGAHYGKDAPQTRRALRDLIDFYTTVGRPADAERYKQEAGAE